MASGEGCIRGGEPAPRPSGVVGWPQGGAVGPGTLLERQEGVPVGGSLAGEGPASGQREGRLPSFAILLSNAKNIRP